MWNFERTWIEFGDNLGCHFQWTKSSIFKRVSLWVLITMQKSQGSESTWIKTGKEVPTNPWEWKLSHFHGCSYRNSHDAHSHQLCPVLQIGHTYFLLFSARFSIKIGSPIINHTTLQEKYCFDFYPCFCVYTFLYLLHAVTHSKQQEQLIFKKRQTPFISANCVSSGMQWPTY